MDTVVGRCQNKLRQQVLQRIRNRKSMENQNTWVDIAFDAFVTLKNDTSFLLLTTAQGTIHGDAKCKRHCICVVPIFAPSGPSTIIQSAWGLKKWLSPIGGLHPAILSGFCCAWCRDMQRYAEICRDMQRYAEICRDMQRYAECKVVLPLLGFQKKKLKKASGLKSW